MTQQKQEKILGKVQKILALANNNSSQEEAHTAMLKAQQLLAKYNLTMEDVETEEKDKEVVDVGITDYGRTLWWKKSLSNTIAENFRCMSYTSRANGKSCIKFIGLKEDVELAREVFNFAISSIDYNLTVYSIRKRLTAGEKNDFIRGYLKGLKDKLAEQVDKEGWGMVLMTDALVENYISKMKFKKVSNSKVSSGGSNQAFDSGYEKGKNFSNSNKQIK